MNCCILILRPAGGELAAASSSREAPICNSQLSEAVTEQLLRAQQTQMQAPEEQVGTWLTKTPCHGMCHQEGACMAALSSARKSGLKKPVLKQS